MAFAVDPVGAALATLAGVLATAALTFSWRIFEAVRTLHHGLMLVFLAGIVGFCLSGDLFNMFVFYELFSVAAYALAGYRTTDPGSVRGALNFAITNSVGAILVLAGIALLYGRTGALNLAQLGQSLAGGRPTGSWSWRSSCSWSGSSSRRRWCRSTSGWPTPTPLPPPWSGCCSPAWCRSSACTPSPASTGRCSRHPLAGIEGLRGVMLLGAVTTALVGGVMCLLQHHLARMLAYATVSHVGLTLAGFALLGPAGAGGAVLYLVADGMLKGSLFISVGILDHHLGDVDELRLQGQGRHLPWLAGLMVAGALGLAGVPPFGTFLGKALMEEAASETGVPWLIGLFVAVAALTSAALLRAIGRVFLGLGPGAGPGRATPVPPARRPSATRTCTPPRSSRPSCCWPAPWPSAWPPGWPPRPSTPPAASPTGPRTPPPCSREPPTAPWPSPTRRSTSPPRPCGRSCRRCSASGSRWPPSSPSGCPPACAAASAAPGARPRTCSVACTTAASVTR